MPRLIESGKCTIEKAQGSSLNNRIFLFTSYKMFVRAYETCEALNCLINIDFISVLVKFPHSPILL